MDVPRKDARKKKIIRRTLVVLVLLAAIFVMGLRRIARRMGDLRAHVDAGSLHSYGCW